MGSEPKPYGWDDERYVPLGLYLKAIVLLFVIFIVGAVIMMGITMVITALEAIF